MKLAPGKVCIRGANIRTVEECKDAATELGLGWGRVFDGDGEHPGCVHVVRHPDDPQHDKVYFYKSETPHTSRVIGYFSICRIKPLIDMSASSGSDYTMGEQRDMTPRELERVLSAMSISEERQYYKENKDDQEVLRRKWMSDYGGDAAKIVA